GACAVALRLREQFCAGEECEIVGYLCLIQCEHVCTIVELNFDGIKAASLDAPRLFADHLGLKAVPVAVGYLEAEHILEIVLYGIPAWRPGRKRQVQNWLMQVLDVGCHVKDLTFDARNRDGIVDVKCVSVLGKYNRREYKDDGKDDSPGEHFCLHCRSLNYPISWWLIEAFR